MTETERIVRIFHESWDMRDPDRGATVIADDCQFEDIARGELQIGPDNNRFPYSSASAPVSRCPASGDQNNEPAAVIPSQEAAAMTRFSRHSR